MIHTQKNQINAQKNCGKMQEILKFFVRDANSDGHKGHKPAPRESSCCQISEYKKEANSAKGRAHRQSVGHMVTWKWGPR